jgi:curved DNA-binding protein
MEYKDYYAIMGLSKEATQDEVKRAYRKLARKYHPDVSKEAGAEASFKELGEAYEVLKDPEKRALYDELGSNWQAGQEFRPPPGWDVGYEHSGSGFSAEDASRASDFFESLFGRRDRGGFHPRHRAGAYQHQTSLDHHARVAIDLEDAFVGATRTITLRTPVPDGQGHVRLQNRTLNVKIPKGVRQGQQIRLAGQGHNSGSGQDGDLYLEVVFRAHPIFRVDDRDIYLTLPVTPWEAALGAKVKVPTPSGTVEMKIPENSIPGSKLRMKGRGIPGKPAGDLYALIEVALPPADTPQARELYEKMKEELAFNPRAQLGV